MQPSKFENPTISISQTKATALAEEPLTSSFVSQCTSASVSVGSLSLPLSLKMCRFLAILLTLIICICNFFLSFSIFSCLFSIFSYLFPFLRGHSISKQTCHYIFCLLYCYQCLPRISISVCVCVSVFVCSRCSVCIFP